MKKLVCLLLMISLLLCACGGQKADPTTATDNSTAPTENSTEPTENLTVTTGTQATEPSGEPEVTEPSSEPSEPETTVPSFSFPDVEDTEPTAPSESEPTEPPVVIPTDFTNPLTGEYITAPYKNRPFMVVMDNDNEQAMPHWGMSSADIVWEMPHEGNTTRFLGMFTDVSDVARLGPNRSARPYLLNLSMGYDAIFVHAGHSTQAAKDLETTGWDHIDGVKNDYSYFRRDKGRLDAGIDSWHTMYISGSNLLKAVANRGFATSRGDVVDYGMVFAPDGTPDGSAANSINIRFSKGGKKTDLWYDAELGKYMAQQRGKTLTDGNNGQAVTFENVLILKADVGTLNDYGALTVDLVGSGSGYFACGGQYVKICWSRSSTNKPFTFTLEDGSPLTFGVGTTYAAVIKDNAPVNFG